MNIGVEYQNRSNQRSGDSTERLEPELVPEQRSELRDHLYERKNKGWKKN